MLKTVRPLLISVGLALLAGCSQKPPAAPAPAATADAPTVHQTMTEVIAPVAEAMWAVTNRAFDSSGGALDPSKISPADWAQLAKTGGQLRDGALTLAQTKHIAVVDQGQAIMGEDATAGVPSPHGAAYDTATAKQVQDRIDANPALFVERAQALADAGDAVVKASQTKDIKALSEITSGLDDVCDACHKPFWGTDEPPPFLKGSPTRAP